MISAADIETELNRPDRGKRTVFQNILLLGLSVVVFAATGLLKASWISVALLVAVLFIHESGHWLGMKLFGYRNLQMFFIPFFGAAVTGKETTTSGERRAIVSLLGPAPGIILGIISGIVFLKWREPVLLQFGLISVLINAFNLLPIYPLDGGRFMETIVFSRHPAVEIVFKVIAGLALAGIAFLLKSIGIGILAFFTLILAKEIFFQNQIVSRLKEIQQGRTFPATGRIPTDQLEAILPELSLGLGAQNIKVRTLANRAEAVWRKASQQPPGLKPSLVLLVVYIGILALGVVGALAGTVLTMVANEKSVIVQRETGSGKPVSFAEKYYGKIKIFEVQLNDKGLYNGPSRTWTVKGVISQEGPWANGFWQGDWKSFDANGNVTSITTYYAGRPMKYQKAHNGELIEVSPDQWPLFVTRGVQLKPQAVPHFNPSHQRNGHLQIQGASFPQIKDYAGSYYLGIHVPKATPTPTPEVFLPKNPK